MNAQEPAGRPHPMVMVLAGVIFAECTVFTVAVAYFVVELFSAVPDSYPIAIAIVVLLALGALWLGLIAAGWLRGRRWVRGATFMWQVLQLALAVGCFQGTFARPDIGWLLLVLALAAVALLFSRHVIAVTARR